MITSKVGLSSRVVALGCLCGIVASCVPSLNGNDPREPNREVPAGFNIPAVDSAAPTSSGPAMQLEATNPAQATWTTFFDSAELRSLIETAIGKNQELNARLQEIIIARNEAYSRQGNYMPQVSAGVGVGVEKVGKYTSQGVSDDRHGVADNLGDFTFGLRGTWEVDIWKKLRNAVKAANLRYLASIEGRNFLITQIVAEIARSYYELVAIDSQLEILRRNIDVLTNALEVVRLQKQAARVTELAVQRFEAEVLKNRSRLYKLEQDRVQAENKINFLVGRFPQTIPRNAQKFKDPLPNVIQAGLPSQLLENRPDVRMAELALEASKLDVQIARAEFYPSLSIDASVGYRAFNPKHLLETPESIFYNLAGNLTAPLLNRRAIQAQYQSANAQQIQAVFNYEKTVLQAFTDVANQLAMIVNLQKSYDLQSQQVDALARASETSNTLFQSARADYMEVLLTRRDSLDAQMELIETRKQQLQALVNLYQALGGGWRSSANGGAAGGSARAAAGGSGGPVIPAPPAAPIAPGSNGATNPAPATSAAPGSNGATTSGRPAAPGANGPTAPPGR